jgi:L-asparagine oxygenase
MDGSLIDLGYLGDAVKDWTLTRDPLEDPTGIATEFGRKLADLMQPAHLARLGLLAKSAVPWIHLKNFHTNAVVDGETPLDLPPKLGDRRWWYPAYATLALLGALKLRVVSYTCESQGWIFVHLTPKPGKGSQAENSLSAMGGHTDALHFPFPNEFDKSNDTPPPAPDFVVLTAIRNPDGVNTLVARLSKLLESISSMAQDSLRLPVFLFHKQDTFDTKFDKLVGYPVLKQHRDYGDFVRFSSSRVSVDSEKFPEADKALEELRNAIPKCREPIRIAPGDIVLVNNRTALHGRDALGKQEYGGNTRWLLRTYGYREDTPGRFNDNDRPHLLFCDR